MFEVCVKIIAELAVTLCRLSDVLKTGRLCVASIFRTARLWQTQISTCVGLCSIGLNIAVVLFGNHFDSIKLNM